MHSADPLQVCTEYLYLHSRTCKLQIHVILYIECRPLPSLHDFGHAVYLCTFTVVLYQQEQQQLGLSKARS
jgi:hypothetical protein